MSGATIQSKRKAARRGRDGIVLVVGATGQLGGLIASGLLKEGIPVRALVRPGSDGTHLRSLGAVLVEGDLKDPASLASACRGVDVVVTTANSAARDPPDTPEAVEMEGNRNLIEAAKRAEVRRFVFVSAYAADPAHPSPFLAGKGQTEEALIDSGLEYTILRPDLFMESWIGMIVGMPIAEGNPITLVGEGRVKHSFISIRDVAAFACKAVHHPSAANARLDLGGPEAVTWCEVVEAFGAAMGMTYDIETVEPGHPLPGLPELVAHLMNDSESTASVIEMDKLAAEFDIPLCSVAEFAQASIGVGR